MSSADYILLVFYLTIISLKTSIQLDKFCDRNYSSLVFDSVVAIERGSEVRFWLFYGDVFYESNPMEIGSDERPTFQVKRNVTEIHPNISAPIDLSYYRNYTIGLVNFNVSMKWSLDVTPEPTLQLLPLSNLRSTLYNDTYTPTRFIMDMIYWHEIPYQFTVDEANEGIVYLLDDPKEDIRYYFQRTPNNTLVKLDLSARNYMSRINGSRIKSATDITINGTTFFYLFAGRKLCRQEVSEQFVELCDAEDIADWINCADTRDMPENPEKPKNPEKSGISWIIIGLSLGVIVLLIVAIALTVCLWKRNKDNQNKDTTAGKENTANLMSDNSKPNQSGEEMEKSLTTQKTLSDTSNK